MPFIFKLLSVKCAFSVVFFLNSCVYIYAGI